jgi:glycosyltransferase involved in cell wall biosynthesis
MRRLNSGRPPVSFIAWSSVAGRSQEMASALGGEARCFYDFGFVRKSLIPLRYAASALRTTVYLLRRRPRAVIVSNPPVFPAAIAWLYCRLASAPLILDSHPSAFGFYETKKLVKLTMPLHRFLIRQAEASIVTVEDLTEMVRAEGGRAEIVHEAPPLWAATPAPTLGARPSLLFVGIFADDEPVELVAAAARQLPDVDFRMTGDLRKCPPAILEDKPANLELLGFLGPDDYRDAVDSSHVIITLTTRPEAVNRAANEAVFAKRPLIISDWPAMRSFFPHAIAVENRAESLVAGVKRAVADYDKLVVAAEEAVREQQGRWDEQLALLRDLVAGETLPKESERVGA